MIKSGFWYNCITDGVHGSPQFVGVDPTGAASISTQWNLRDNIERNIVERAVDYVLNATAAGHDRMHRSMLAMYPGARVEQLDWTQSGFWERLFGVFGIRYNGFFGDKLPSPFGRNDLPQGIIIDTDVPDQKPSNVYENSSGGAANLPLLTALGEFENFHFHSIGDAVASFILPFGNQWRDYHLTSYGGSMQLRGPGNMGPGAGTFYDGIGSGGGGSHGTRGSDAAQTRLWTTAGTNRFNYGSIAGPIVPAEAALAAIINGRYRAETLGMGGYGGNNFDFSPGPGQVVIAPSDYTERRVATVYTRDDTRTPTAREELRRENLNLNATDTRSSVSEAAGGSSGGLYLAVVNGLFTWDGRMTARGKVNGGAGGSGGNGRLTVFCLDGAIGLEGGTRVTDAVIEVFQIHPNVPFGGAFIFS